MRSVLLTSLALLSGGLAFAADQPDGAVVPVHMVVTVEGKNPPPVQGADVQVHQGKDRARVRDWVALEGDRAGLQLAVLIDDGANTNLGVQLADLKKFIAAQPATTEISIGYMRNGDVQMTQSWTADHASAAKALRLPIGMPGIDASPYISLSEFVKKWPETDKRREVLMISNGVDYLYDGPPPSDPYLETAIHDVQKAGVVFFSIYFGGEGHISHNFWRINWGENYLSQLSDRTGGESYWQGFGNPVSFAPFLDDLSEKLAHQYRLTLLAKAPKKSSLEPVKLRTELHHIELLSADRVYVPAP